MGRAIEVDKRLDNVEADVRKLYEILTELTCQDSNHTSYPPGDL